MTHKCPFLFGELCCVSSRAKNTILLKPYEPQIKQYDGDYLDLYSVENRNILDNRVDMYFDTFSYEKRTIARSLQNKANDFVGYRVMRATTFVETAVFPLALLLFRGQENKAC